MYKEYVVYKTYLLIDTSQMSMYVILTWRLSLLSHNGLLTIDEALRRKTFKTVSFTI